MGKVKEKFGKLREDIYGLNANDQNLTALRIRREGDELEKNYSILDVMQFYGLI